MSDISRVCACMRSIAPALMPISRSCHRPKFRRRISVADSIAFVESLGCHADLRDHPGPPKTGVRDPNDHCLVALAEAARAVDRHR